MVNGIIMSPTCANDFAPRTLNVETSRKAGASYFIVPGSSGGAVPEALTKVIQVISF